VASLSQPQWRIFLFVALSPLYEHVPHPNISEWENNKVMGNVALFLWTPKGVYDSGIPSELVGLHSNCVCKWFCRKAIVKSLAQNVRKQESAEVRVSLKTTNHTHSYQYSGFL